MDEAAVDGITIEQIGALIFEARHNPNSERIVALRLALEEIDREAQARRDHVEASQAVAGGARWRDVADNHVTHDELEQLRAEQSTLPRRPEPHPDLVTAFERAEEEETSRREAWRRDDEADQTGQAVTR
jgi:hypothetical protein